MSIQINKSAYEKLIKEDIEWLLSNTKDSLERRHIVEVLNYSPERLYASGSSEIPKDQDIVEASEKYAGELYGYELKSNEDLQKVIACICGFKAGAKWQAKQDQETIELAEDHAYLAGAVNEREKMMKEAVEGHILGEIRNQEDEPYEIYAESDFLPLNGKFKMGDKVKLIIVKEEEKHV